jgi:dihydrofolate reductase
MNRFSLIVATDFKNGIGRLGTIPWHIPADLKNFKRLTTNNVVVMGRLTYESLFVPLPHRTTAIVSTTMRSDTNHLIFNTIEEMIRYRCHNDEYNKEWFIIGGSTLYNYFLHHSHHLEKIYWTQVHGNYNCDTFIRPIDVSEWNEIRSEPMPGAMFREYGKKLQKYII